MVLKNTRSSIITKKLRAGRSGQMVGKPSFSCPRPLNLESGPGEWTWRVDLESGPGEFDVITFFFVKKRLSLFIPTVERTTHNRNYKKSMIIMNGGGRKRRRSGPQTTLAAYITLISINSCQSRSWIPAVPPGQHIKYSHHLQRS